ncbi:NADH-quinone oxidoreductase subunit M [Microbulbifer sp.]|uniref:complex I subunit 4 family protein n=1 Tax=Microbulbifer sp. TaxID=1908541 RepID=UPI0025858657|nr:NADH-quinone oxidoreductase subunit M [Microbulbifer sp.]
MTLVAIVSLLFVGGLLAYFAEYLRAGAARWLAVISVLSALLLLGRYLPNAMQVLHGETPRADQVWDHLQVLWIPRFGIHFAVAIDGLSFLMLSLTLIAGLFGLWMCWRERRFGEGFYYANYLWVLAGVVGVFCARDLFLFFCFWEVMLVPMSLLIALWGHGQKNRAAIQFFIFTQASSLFLLIAIIGVVLTHFRQTGEVSFLPAELSQTLLSSFSSSNTAFWLMLGFFVAFAVKLPIIPFHPWLPDAHTQAPTAGSVLLAAILLKTGAYGLIRFTLPLFPEASLTFAPMAAGLGVAGILYGALMAFAQTDVKRLVAYSSISHMGFVLLGIYSFTAIGLQGAVAQMVAHGLSTAALFGLAGVLQARFHTRDMLVLGGLSVQMPRWAAMLLFFTVAAMGLPGLANFVGELLALMGSFKLHPWMTVLATGGLIGSALYGLKLIRQLLFGTPRAQHPTPPQSLINNDLLRHEMLALALPLLLLIGLGLSPQLMLRQSAAWTEIIVERVNLSSEQDTDRKPHTDQGRRQLEQADSRGGRQ